MKNFSFLLFGLVSCFLLISCTTTITPIGMLQNHTNVTLERNNFKYVAKDVRGESSFRTSGLKGKEGLTALAMSDLRKKYPLKDNQAYVNVTFDYLTYDNGNKGRSIITADIIEFVDNNSSDQNKTLSEKNTKSDSKSMPIANQDQAINEKEQNLDDEKVELLFINKQQRRPYDIFLDGKLIISRGPVPDDQFIIPGIILGKVHNITVKTKSSNNKYYSTAELNFRGEYTRTRYIELDDMIGKISLKEKKM